MMVNGKMIKSMEQVNFNILIKQSIMVNGKMILEKVTEPTIIRTVIDMKDNGTKIFKMG